MFDLPVTTKAEKKAAASFRRFLQSDGYNMLQFSVYTRICNGIDAVEKHKGRLKKNLPGNGSVRVLVLTEKQYESMELLIGPLVIVDESYQTEQLSIF